MICQRPKCRPNGDPIRATYVILIEGQRLPVCLRCSNAARAEGFDVRPMYDYVRVSPCPECEHDTEHEDEACYCEVARCDCDRTSVEGFWREIAIA